MIERIDPHEKYFIASPSEAPEAGIVFDSVNIVRYETTGTVEFRLLLRGEAHLVCLDVESVDGNVEKALRRIAEEEPETKTEREALLPAGVMT